MGVSSNLRGPANATEPEVSSMVELLEMPEEAGELDHPGPYAEEPDVSGGTNPKRVSEAWLLSTANSSVGADLCNAHGTGFWCNGTARLRCCKLQNQSQFVKCGSTANSTFCALPETSVQGAQNDSNNSVSSSWWGGGSWGGDYDDRRRRYDDRRRQYDDGRRRGGSWGGGGWHIHQGWHTNSYCQSHHVGRFCVSHHIIHCCNDYGHFVECNSAYTHSNWWC